VSFLRKQESRVVGVSGFRIKCGMTAKKLLLRICGSTIRFNPRNLYHGYLWLKFESKIYLDFKKQSQSRCTSGQSQSFGSAQDRFKDNLSLSERIQFYIAASICQNGTVFAINRDLKISKKWPEKFNFLLSSGLSRFTGYNPLSGTPFAVFNI
jgi:hypothetical protein